MRFPRRFLARWPVGRVNAACVGLAGLWISVSVPLGILLKPTIPDFEQFYVAGSLVARGEWGSLYPVPRPGSLSNPGLRIDSEARPAWKALSRERGVWDHTHFMLPPPAALAFVPLSALSYPRALGAWTAFQMACAWGVAAAAAALLRACLGRPTRWEGLLALAIAASPVTARAIRIANVSVPVAGALAVALLSLVRRKNAAGGALALLGGALLKYATLVLVPLLLAMRRWKMLACLSLFGALALGATFVLAGSGPFGEFYREILPTLSRPSAFRGNQSFPGLLARVAGRPLPPGLSALLNGARAATGLAVLWLLLSADRSLWSRPARVLAGAALLLSWLLFFSPIAWEHWPVFLFPCWGWLLLETRQRSGWARAAASMAFLLIYFPAGIFQVPGFLHVPLAVPEPWNSTQMAGVALTGILAFRRLCAAAAAARPARARS